MEMRDTAMYVKAGKLESLSEEIQSLFLTTMKFDGQAIKDKGGLAVSAESAKDPDKKAAGEAFIKFFYAPENYKIFCEKMSAIPATVDQPELCSSDIPGSH